MIKFTLNTHTLPIASEPKIKDFKRYVHIGEGEEVSLKVEFTGFPKPSIDWFYDGMRLDSNSLNGREILNDGTIFIKEANRKHAGIYDFIVSNSLGSVEGCTKLTVYIEEEVDTSTVDRRKRNGTKLESHMVKKERFGEHVSHCHTFNNKGFTAEFQVGVMSDSIRAEAHAQGNCFTNTIACNVPFFN